VMTRRQRVSLTRRTVLLTTTGLVILFLLAVLGLGVQSFLLVPKLFKLNKACQEEGYYMAEFEFQMLGFAHLLDKGRYWEAAAGIRKLHERLRTRSGLVRVPVFADKGRELEFYLGLQNPRTGAFMDDAFPYCTYDEPTSNVLLHLEALAKQTGQPLRLSSERFGRLDKVYVHCRKDNAISLPRQRQFAAKWPMRKVITLDSGHSPFLSMPKRLSEVLASELHESTTTS